MSSAMRRSASALLPLLILALAVPSRAEGQEGAIAGTVRDSASMTPLVSVEVQAVDASGAVAARALTGAGGAFRLPQVPAGGYTLRLSLPGWQTLEIPVTVSPGETASVSVELVPRAYNLNPLTVSAGRTEQKVLDAPAAIQVVEEREIFENPAPSIYDHLEGMAGVDLFRAGLQQGYAVARGFNNVFSGSTVTLTDHRFATVPSLRANVLYLNPTTNPDLERVEVVLGPGSALWGPNASNGVIHMITRSPLDDPGLQASVAGGGRSSGAGDEAGELFHAEARAALAPSETFGIKLSGQYFRGDDWVNVEPAEEDGRELAQLCLATPQDPRCAALPPSVREDPEQLARVGERDFDLERWSLDLRADYRPSDELETIFQAGRTNAGNTIELTGIGAAQARDWSYTYLQSRTSYRGLFGQTFFTLSNAGDTFILATGQPIVDRSWVLAGQLQNTTRVGARQRFGYGLDAIRTNPVTEGTINGVNEDEDGITEIGGYLQSETRLTERLDLVAAARVDHHSVLDKAIFSPRAGLVYTVAEGHTVRATFNRAFSTPTTNNLFLDIAVRTIPIPGTPFAYGVRAQGTTASGFTFRRTNGRPDMRTPFAPLLGAAPTDFIPTTTQTLWQIAAGLVSQNPDLPPGVAEELLAIAVPTEEEVGIDLLLLNATTGDFEPLPAGFGAVQDIPAVKEEITNTFEVGYKGLLGNQVLVAANAWYERRNDFVGPLRVETPNAFLAGQELGAYLVPRLAGRLVARGYPQEQAVQIATGVATSMAMLPVGVLSPEETTGEAASLMLTYRNFGELDLFGGELSARVLLTDEWWLDGSASWTSDDVFPQEDGPAIALNASSFKTSGAVGYRSERIGVNAQVRYRFTKGFPVNSGVFVGEVDDYHLVDLNAGYRIPGLRDLTVQVDVQNVLNDEYLPFVGAPRIGRMALLRLVYDFRPF